MPLRQPAGAVADEGDADVHAFEEGLPEVGDGRFLGHAHVAAALDGAAAAGGEVVLHGAEKVAAVGEMGSAGLGVASPSPQSGIW